MEQTHAHEVLQMMMASNKTYTHASLEADIISRFGPDARFYTCSAEMMTAAELVSFLEAKGKFIPQAGGFQTSPDVMCKH
jgi:probable metal-binding protein